MSYSGDDEVDCEVPIFTQEEAFMLGGWLAEVWGIEATTEQVVEDTEQAIRSILSRDYPC